MSLTDMLDEARTGARRWLPLIALLTVAAIPAFIFMATSTANASVKCEGVPSPPYVAAKAVTALAPADQRTTTPPAINFGTSRASQDVAPYTFTFTGPAPNPSKMSWDLLLVNGNATFPESHASVRFSNAVGYLRVSLCLTPAGVPTGSYSGGLTIAGPGVKPVQLPLTVNLKDNNLALIWVGIVIAAAAAVFFKWWTVKVADPGVANSVSITELKQLALWLRDQWVTVLIAVAGAAGGVYIAKFQSSNSFVPGDRWELWATTFTAVMSAALLLNALGIAVQPKTKKNEAKRQH